MGRESNQVLMDKKVLTERRLEQGGELIFCNFRRGTTEKPSL